MATFENDVGILNTLIGATRDSADAYRDAADCLDTGELRTVFQRRAAERKIIAAHLQEHLEAVVSTPDAGITPAPTDRTFKDLAGAARADHAAVFNEVKRGENRLKVLYQEALDSSALSELSLTVVRNAFHSVRLGVDDLAKLEPAVREA